MTIRDKGWYKNFNCVGCKFVKWNKTPLGKDSVWGKCYAIPIIPNSMKGSVFGSFQLVKIKGSIEPATVHRDGWSSVDQDAIKVCGCFIKDITT